MNNVASVDPNFKVNTELNIEDIRFYDVRQAPFRIYGVFYVSGKFRRIPEKVAKTVKITIK